MAYTFSLLDYILAIRGWFGHGVESLTVTITNKLILCSEYCFFQQIFSCSPHFFCGFHTRQDIHQIFGQVLLFSTDGAEVAVNIKIDNFPRWSTDSEPHSKMKWMSSLSPSSIIRDSFVNKATLLNLHPTVPFLLSNCLSSSTHACPAFFDCCSMHTFSMQVPWLLIYWRRHIQTWAKFFHICSLATHFCHGVFIFVKEKFTFFTRLAEYGSKKWHIL